MLWGHTQSAILIAAATAVMIGLKQPIHAWTRTFTVDDIRATLQFVAITGVVLPLVPDRNYGPYAAFNPYATWLMVVLISGLGFVGYIMMRLLGAQAGITVTGLVGGLASSTATTLAFSRRSRDEPAMSGSYALAVITACTVMLARILVVVGVINAGLAASLVAPLGLMAIPGVGFILWAWLFHRPAREAVAPPRLHNPLTLGVAIKFAVVYAVVAFLVKAATHLEVHGGLLPLSFISGLTDVDAMALLMANSRTDGSVAAGACRAGRRPRRDGQFGAQGRLRDFPRRPVPPPPGAPRSRPDGRRRRRLARDRAVARSRSIRHPAFLRLRVLTVGGWTLAFGPPGP